MSCYICLEEGIMMEEKGCGCKGSIGVHSACFQEWVKTAANPFMCPVCKTDYHASFLSSFMTMEQMMKHGSIDDEEEEDDEEDGEALMYQEHGVPVVEVNGILYFETTEHFSIYQHSYKMEISATRLECKNQRQKEMRFSKQRPKMDFIHKNNRNSRSKGNICMRR